MSLVVETDCPVFNKMVQKFESNMKHYFPDCPPEIFAMACHDYVLNLKNKNISWKPLIEKYIKQETGRDDKIMHLMIQENQQNNVYDEKEDI